jgi:antitoxin component YwqK of YwqJK toxin-antitoxin module
MHTFRNLLKNIWFVVLFVSAYSQVAAQQNENTPVTDGYTVFKYPSGKISSEGTMKAGKPDGYWKTYFENGVLKSEGNRKNFMLDSVWKFYDDSARLMISINYKNDKKNGLKTTFRTGEITTETYVNDVKQGPTTYYYPDGKVRLIINFIDGLENGVARELAPDGNVITYLEYKKGFLISRERINRTDANGRKQGRWKYFYDNEKIRLEGTFKDDKRNGYFKEYDQEGNLLTVKKFINDTEQIEVQETASLKLKTDYYPDGKVKTVGSYNGDTPEGVRREYNQEGKITGGYVFTKGVLTGEGITDEEGNKEGDWKQYYTDGTLRSVGSYSKGKTIGNWKYYYENGKLESEGKYTKSGLPDGLWRWYFEDGSIRRSQSFIAGMEDGEYEEHDETGRLIVKGQYAEGVEEGDWIYDFGNYRETGSYKSGARFGTWKSYYNDGQLRFEGNYLDDNLNGKVSWYWPNGKLKDQGNYINGSREGDWVTFNEDGTPFLIITYRNDVEKRYDGMVIKPSFEE